MIKAHKAVENGLAVIPQLPEGWQATPASQEVVLQHAGDTASADFEISIPETAVNGSYQLSAHAVLNGKTINSYFTSIDYPHIS